MSDQNDTQDQQQDDIKGIRAQLEALREENKTLKSERRQRAYKDAGLPEGAYDIFDKTYDGELSADALREFAEAKGFRVGSNDSGTESAQVDEAQQSREQGQSRLDAVDAAKLPSDKPDLKTQIVEAMAAGDWEKSRALKHQLLDEHNRATRRANAII